MLLLAAASKPERRAALADALAEFRVRGHRALNLGTLCLTGHLKGSRSVVSLPTRRAGAFFEEIEGDLRGGAPRLASMFAIFTRLTKDDGAPLTEALQHVGLCRRIWLHSRLAAELILAVPLALALVALVAFVTLSSSGMHGCQPDRWGRTTWPRAPSSPARRRPRNPELAPVPTVALPGSPLPVALGVGFPERQAEARLVRVGRQHPVGRVQARRRRASARSAGDRGSTRRAAGWAPRRRPVRAGWARNARRPGGCAPPPGPTPRRNSVMPPQRVTSS